MDSPVMILVKEWRKWQICWEIDNGCVESLWSKFRRSRIVDSTRKSARVIDWRQVRRLCSSCIQSMDNFVGKVWRVERRSGPLLATNPDVIWNRAQESVPRVCTQNSTESIFEIISATRLKTNSVHVKPRSPKKSSKPIHVTINQASSIISASQIDIRLNVEIDCSNYTCGRKQRHDWVDDRIKVRLSEVRRRFNPSK